MLSCYIADHTLRYLKIGFNQDECWNNSHTRIQLEDIIDCLSVMCPKFGFVFKHNRSSGHTKVREDKLVATNMNVSYRVVSTMMCGTIIRGE